VILATNIAETSITIDGIKYVVDPGLVKIRLYQSSKMIESLSNYFFKLPFFTFINFSFNSFNFFKAKPQYHKPLPTSDLDVLVVKRQENASVYTQNPPTSPSPCTNLPKYCALISFTPFYSY